MTKLEEIALAIGRVVARTEVEPRKAWLEAARVAVEELREPSTAVLDAMPPSPIVTFYSHAEEKRKRAAAKDKWQAQIDAILNEKSE